MKLLVRLRPKYDSRCSTGRRFFFSFPRLLGDQLCRMQLSFLGGTGLNIR